MVSIHRAGAGYKNRRVYFERECTYCGVTFVLRSSARAKQVNVYCSREHYAAALSSR